MHIQIFCILLNSVRKKSFKILFTRQTESFILSDFLLIQFDAQKVF
jgi:hypothetical protein